MPRQSAGIVLTRLGPAGPELLLVHPGGPFWARKDDGVWSIPKGEYESGEDPLAVAEREFAEELGVACPLGERLALGSVRQKGGKVVTAWCVVGEIDVAVITSNTFEMEWPPRSGRTQAFPEIDRAGYFDADQARVKILASQSDLIDRTIAALGGAGLL